MGFKFKIKPKIKLAKLFKNKKLEFKSIDTELKYEAQLDDGVLMKANIVLDLNISKLKSAEISFTKKF